MVGIVKSEVNVNTRSLFATGGYFVFADGLRLYGEGKIINTSTGLTQSCVGVGQEFRLFYSPTPVPTLRVSVNGSGFVTLPFQVFGGDYRPCVQFDKEDTVLEILKVYPDFDLLEHRTKRSKTMLGEMWQDCAFSDCTVYCGDNSLRCHRVVLSTASPVWRAALDSKFREGCDAAIHIDDAEPSVVKSLVRYAYTSCVEEADVAALMPLAHRYDMPGLVALCGNALLDNLAVENVAQTVYLINRFKDHEEVNPLWQRLVLKVHLDAKLCEAALTAVRP